MSSKGKFPVALDNSSPINIHTISLAPRSTQAQLLLDKPREQTAVVCQHVVRVHIHFNGPVSAWNLSAGLWQPVIPPPSCNYPRSVTSGLTSHLRLSCGLPRSPARYSFSTVGDYAHLWSSIHTRSPSIQSTALLCHRLAKSRPHHGRGAPAKVAF